MKKSILGDENPSTLHTMHTLAYTYLQLQRGGEAYSMIVDCIDKRKSVLGEMHPKTLTSMSVLALVCCEVKKFEMMKTLWMRIREATGSSTYDNLIGRARYLEFLQNLHESQAHCDTGKTVGCVRFTPLAGQYAHISI